MNAGFKLTVKFQILDHFSNNLYHYQTMVGISSETTDKQKKQKKEQKYVVSKLQASICPEICKFGPTIQVSL